MSVQHSKGNQEVKVFASAARTATHNSADLNNYNARGIVLTIDCTADPASASVTFKIQGKDDASGKYYDLIESAAIAGTGTTVLRVYPGLTAAANVTVSGVLPTRWRVLATHANGDSITYSVGASLLI